MEEHRPKKLLDHVRTSCLRRFPGKGTGTACLRRVLTGQVVFQVTHRRQAKATWLFPQ
jgi:hypothetical protein